MTTHCLQRGSALVSLAPRPAPARRLAGNARPRARALRRRAGLVVPPSLGRGRALRPPLRPHYGGVHAAHRVVGARRGSPAAPAAARAVASVFPSARGGAPPSRFLPHRCGKRPYRARPSAASRAANGHRAAPPLPLRPRFPSPGGRGTRARSACGRSGWGAARSSQKHDVRRGLGAWPGSPASGPPPLGGGCQA